MSVNNSLVCWPLETYGSEDQLKKFLTPLAKGEKLGAYCLSEPGAGTDAAAQALRSGWVSQGPRVAEFEQAFARYENNNVRSTLVSGPEAQIGDLDLDGDVDLDDYSIRRWKTDVCCLCQFENRGGDA